MTHIITEPCVNVKDTACIDVCPVDCIYGKDANKQILYIHPEECIDCGLCVDACPVEAIYPEEAVPQKWLSWIAVNYRYFNLDPPSA
jgi:NAD-dependent dihydropyrimidine dehydrogenase PreA subunit